MWLHSRNTKSLSFARPADQALHANWVALKSTAKLAACSLGCALFVFSCARSPKLDDAVTCPDGGACAVAPDGGCDPLAPQPSTCPAGQVCASDGTCGAPCGNGNTVCDPTTVCDSTSDCVPPCRDASGAVIALDPLSPGQTCLSAGYLEPADPSAQCLLPCWYVLCTSVRRGYGGGC